MQITIGDMEFEYRGLTRGELRKLKEAGVDFDVLARGGAPAAALDALDSVFALGVAQGPAADDCTPGVLIALMGKIGEATWLPPDAEKNLPELSGLGLPGSSGTARGAGKRGSKGNGCARK